MTDYRQTLDWLYVQTPQFEKTGASAYKPGLDTVTRLSEAFGSPHKGLRCIHVAGTNGKGSTSSMIAASLQSAGLKTGLYTSPHISDFRERIRVDGEMIPKQEVADFVDRYRRMDLGLQPSFFELTTVMALDFFARSSVDIAVIEVGLGGRLDSTNIVTPDVSVVSNISLDHTDLLGNTLEQIATEKAGIFKPGIPAVVGPVQQPEVMQVFESQAAKAGTQLYRADMADGDIPCTLAGDFQRLNVATAVRALRFIPEVTPGDIAAGLRDVARLTGLRGRMTRVSLPGHQTLIYDTGHNPGAWVHIAAELRKEAPLAIVIGFVADKDVDTIVGMLPHDADCFFTQPDSKRALPVEDLHRMAVARGLHGKAYAQPAEAIDAAVATGKTVFVGGSNYLVGELNKSPWAIV